MKKNHKPQQNYPEKVFKIMSSLFLSNLKIQFSDRHNSLYGYSDFLARLFEMCRYSQYAETAYNSRFIKDAKSQCKRIPCGKWMLGVIKQVRYDYMLTRCLKMADRTVMRMKTACSGCLWMWQSTSTPFQDTTRRTTCIIIP